MHIRKIVSIFRKDHLEKSTAISPPLDSTSLMAKLTNKLSMKQKQRQPAKKRTTKYVK